MSWFAKRDVLGTNHLQRAIDQCGRDIRLERQCEMTVPPPVNEQMWVGIDGPSNHVAKFRPMQNGFARPGASAP